MSTNTPTDYNHQIVDDLKEQLAACGGNKNDQAIIGITECITAGIVTRKGIRDTLARVGLHPKHVVMMLNDETGSDPVRHRWERDGAGVYRNLG